MELVLLVETKNASKVKDILLADPVVSLASIIAKDGKTLGKDNYYVYISGLETQCKKALELTKDSVKVLEGEEKEDIINIIKEEQNNAVIGFGGVFGSF